MFAIPGIIGLVFLIYVRPQEFYGPLRSVPLLYVCFALWLFGLIVDLKIGNLTWRKTPHLPLIVTFFLYAALTILIAEPSRAQKALTTFGVCVALFLTI